MNKTLYLNSIQKSLFLLLLTLLPLSSVDGVVTTTLGILLMPAIFCIERLKYIKILLVIFTLYGMWFFASSLWSLYPDMVYKGFRKEFFYSAAALIIGYNCSFEFKSTKPIFLFGLLSLLLSFLASLSRVFPENLAIIAKFYPSVGDGSTSLIFFFSLTTILLLKSKSSAIYLWSGISSLAISSYLAIFYANRMIFVSLAAMLASALIYKLKDSSLKVKLTAVIVAAIIGTSLTVYSLSLKVDLTDGYISTSKEVVKNDPRIFMWDFYIQKGTKKPLIGYGAGYLSLQETFKNDFPDNWINEFKTHAHNVFLNKWLQLGTIGLFLFILMYASIFRYGYSGKFKDSEVDLFKLFLLLMFVGFFSKSLTDDFFIRNNLILFWLLCGFIIGRGAPLSTTKLN